MSEFEKTAEADSKWEADVFYKEPFVISKSFVGIVIMVLFSLGVIVSGALVLAGLLGATDYSFSVLLMLAIVTLISMSACCCSYIIGVLKVSQLEKINKNLEKIAENTKANKDKGGK